MQAHQAYKQQQNTSMPRIELILAVFRKAIDLLRRARQARVDDNAADARLMLAQAQLLVTSLASGDIHGSDEIGANFLRLYEYVSHCLGAGTIADIDAADRVLRTLLEAFAAVREQAAALEAQGKIPPLSIEHQVQVTV